MFRKAILALLIAPALLVAPALSTGPFLAQETEADRVEARIKKLEEKVKRLEERVEELEQKPSNDGNEDDHDDDADDEAAGADDADPYTIYRTVGNKWKLKSTTTIEGMDPLASFTAYEVLEVNDDGAKVKFTFLDADGSEMMFYEMEIPFTTADDMGEAVDEPETTDETITVEAGEFECTKMVTQAGGSTTTSWMSKKHPGLVVKAETSDGAGDTTTELVEYEVD